MGTTPGLQRFQFDDHAWGSGGSLSCDVRVFQIAPGHDSWVVGDEPYVSLHFLGADHYADRS